jgi:hypothetical protein
MRYLPLFILIQLANIPLMLIGIPVVAYQVTRWPHNFDRWAWLWWNDEDGYGPSTSYWERFSWLALRNSVNNLRHVPGVSKIGRPLWIRNWTIGGKLFYAKAGWLSNGYPVMSAGAGKW